MCVHVPEYGIYSFVFYDYPVFILTSNGKVRISTHILNC